VRNYTKRDIYRLVEEEDVGFIRLQFTDIYGMMKNIAITTNQLEKALDNRCVFDGSSIEGFAKDEVLPPVTGLLGSTAITATFNPSRINNMPKASRKVLFPAPGVPVTPSRRALPQNGIMASSSCVLSA